MKFLIENRPVYFTNNTNSNILYAQVYIHDGKLKVNEFSISMFPNEAIRKKLYGVVDKGIFKFDFNSVTVVEC